VSRRPKLVLIRTDADAPVSAQAARTPEALSSVAELAAASQRLSRAFSGSFVTPSGLEAAREALRDFEAAAQRLREALGC
jgi:hypothetical protein